MRRQQGRVGDRGDKGTHVLADAGLAEELEQLELSECPQTEHGVVKGRNFLDCDFATCRSVDG